MIEQDIIVVKEPEKTYPLVNHTPWTSVNSGRWPDIKSQYDLDVWLSTTGFKRGDIVTYIRAPLNYTFDPNIVYRVEEVCTRFEQLTSNAYVPYHPRLVLLKPLVAFRGNTVRPMEWRDVHQLRKCGEHELENYVYPYLDFKDIPVAAND